MTVSIRPADPTDVGAIVAMVHELAGYERAAHECHLTGPQLQDALFGAHPRVFGHVAVDDAGTALGVALWFLNFSTWHGEHGIYLEDLYVRPTARGTGAGRALLAALAGICTERGYSRLDFSVLAWNPAREFYAALGAQALTEWVPYRLSGTPLAVLAAGSPSANQTP